MKAGRYSCCGRRRGIRSCIKSRFPRGGESVIGGFLVRLFVVRLFASFAIVLPVFGAICAERDGRVGVFHCYIVAIDAVAVEFEQVGDPVFGVVPFQIEEQLDGQLAGFDVTGYGKEVTVVGIEGVEDHVIHFKGQLVIAGGRFQADDLCFLEVLLEGGLDDVCLVRRCGSSEAAHNTYGEEQGY